MQVLFTNYARMLYAAGVLSILASGLIPWEPLLQTASVRGINSILAVFGQPTGGSEIEAPDNDWDCRTEIRNGQEKFICTGR